MTNQKIQHKKCVQGIINKTKTTHNCFREHPINVQSDWHFIDVIGHPHKDKEKLLKPFATECETNLNTAQARSNKIDLIEWKRHFPEGEIFQITDESEFDINKLKKNKFGIGFR